MAAYKIHPTRNGEYRESENPATTYQQERSVFIL
jgi:hypothetical protein